jgi:hypothetical protein
MDVIYLQKNVFYSILDKVYDYLRQKISYPRQTNIVESGMNNL